MVPQDIINTAIERTNIKLADIGDGVEATGTTRMYKYLNMSKDLLWNKIVGSSTGRDMSWESWTQDMEALQGEYALPQVVSDENRIKKIESLWICYSWATYSRTGGKIYTVARLVDRASLDNDWHYYEENQSTADPIYYVSDKSIFIAPVSSSTVAEWLQITGVKKIPDYDTNTTEAGMVIPDDMHYLLVDLLMEHIYWKKWAPTNALALRNQNKVDVKETLNVERDSHVWPKIMEFPEAIPSTRSLGRGFNIYN
jgi:hypothetical protein